jgi:hypothetical protein
MGSVQSEKIILIPWDPKSEAHIERMAKQRLACGWRYDEIPEWVGKQLRGTKSLFWMVSLDNTARCRNHASELKQNRFWQIMCQIGRSSLSSISSSIPMQVTFGECYLDFGQTGLT